MKRLILLLAVVALVSCKTTKTKTEASQETKIEYITNTEYRDTGKIVTNTEIEYQVIYDTITKTYVSVKWKERVKLVEKKDKSGKASEVGKVKVKSAQSVKTTEKSNIGKWLVLVVVGVVAGFFFYRFLFK